MTIYKNMDEVRGAIDRIVEERSADVRKVEYVDAKTVVRRIRKAVKANSPGSGWIDVRFSEFRKIHKRLVKREWNVERRKISAPQKTDHRMGEMRTSAWPPKQYIVLYTSPCEKYWLKLVAEDGFSGGHISISLYRKTSDGNQTGRPEKSKA